MYGNRDASMVTIQKKNLEVENRHSLLRIGRYQQKESFVSKIM
jgi:hypothetical protein